MATSDSAVTCIRVLISGRVQGVGYRYNTYRQSQRLAIAGWVQNLPDGRVEAWFEGEAEAVQSMLRWCKVGPLSAQVQTVVSEVAEAQGFSGFQIRR